MKNNILKFKEAVIKAEDILLVPHLSPDGDAVGSSVALKILLSMLGKDSKIYLSESLPGKYEIFRDYFTVMPETDHIFDMVIYVDCGEKSRAAVKFPEPKISCCIDHHFSNTAYCDINIIDAKAPATGEILFEMFEILGIKLNNIAAQAIYMALVCDTGGFLFDNTRKRTHEIAAKLYDYEFSKYETIKKAFLTKSLTYNKLASQLIDKLIVTGDVAVGCIDYETYTKLNVTPEDTDGLSNILRDIEGINCGILLTEKEKNVTKGSIRTEASYNANEIAAVFGGGGHLRAAGFRVDTSPDKVKEKLNEWLSTDK